jgi:acetamidase/formamidase
VHALQGDGVVDQTRLRPLRGSPDPLRPPQACGVDRCVGRDQTACIGVGFADNLEDARVACLRELIAWLHVAPGISEGGADALCSMVASFRVTQYAHQTRSAYSAVPSKTVHAHVPKDVLPSELQARIGSWLRPEQAS